MHTRLLALLVGLTLVVAACGGSDSEPDEGASASDSSEGSESNSGETAAVDGDGDGSDATLTWGKDTDLGDFDPHIAGDASSWQILYLTYDTLVEMDGNLEPGPGLAESWENPEPDTWVFTLREDVTFSNGREMTVDDVVGSLERMWNPDTGAWWVAQTGGLSSITAVDDRTVEIVLEAPNSKFLATMAGVSSSILPIEELEAGEFDPETELLGTGPYAVVEHLPDESWTLEANPHYWGDGPAFANLEILIIADEAARIAALQDGRVDISFFENPDAELLLAGADGVDVITQATTDLYVLQLNNVNPDSSVLDQEVRFAINSAIDRDRIAEIAMGGVAEPTAITPVGLDGACSVADLPSTGASIEEAAAVIERAAPGLELEIQTTEAISRLSEIAQVIQQDLGEIGVEVTVTDLEIGTWNENIYVSQPAEFDGALSFYAGYGEATMLPLWWDIERAVWPGNFLAPNEDVATPLRAAEGEETGSADYVSNLADACAAADQDAAMIPLVTKPILVAVDTNDVEADIHGSEGFADVLRFITDFTPTT